MAFVNLPITSEENELTDVPLVSKDDTQILAHRVTLASSNIIKSEEVNKEDAKSDDGKQDDAVKIKVKYSLNKFKNLEVAKANASRPSKIERITTNDTNIRYEMNSGQYLYVKEEMVQYKKDQTQTSDNGEITITVEKPSIVEDNDENIPESQIKMSITNNKTRDKTNVVIKMYHTNQSIHLQGGRRMGKVTSTSLLADCLEDIWKTNMGINEDNIDEANNALKSMVIKPGMNLRARTSSGDQIIYCDKCDYKCTMNHTMSQPLI